MNFERLSLNFDKKKRLKRQIKLVVFHYTGMQSKVEGLENFAIRDLKSAVIILLMK